MNWNKNDHPVDCPTVVHSGLAYLRSLAPWKGKGGFSLDKMRELCWRLGNPQNNFRSIHVAGTNGKGSVSVTCASILAEAGNSVGLYISPHLSRINERIVINGTPISDQDLNEMALLVKDAAQAAEPSFFEAITACSFLAFSAYSVEWAVIEVGLGGRLDATNVIASPEICIVTSIDFDHQEILGDTLAKIAREKAGIFKPGAVVVIGEEKAEPSEALISSAAKLGLETYSAQREFSWNAWNGISRFRYESQRLGSFEFDAKLQGAHQGQNMAVAITAMRAVGVAEETCKKGIQRASWPGRLETIVFRGREFLVDCAHNPAGFRSLADHISQRELKDFCLIFGAIGTKNWAEMLSLVARAAKKVYVLTPDAPNPVEPKLIADFLSGIGVKSEIFGADYEGALEHARAETDEGGLVVVAGSIYMLGKLRDLISDQPQRLW